MKKCISILILFVFVAVGVFAQNVPLRQGVYRSPASSDEVWVRANAIFNPQINRWEPRDGWYIIATYVGHASNNVQWVADTGPVRGNEIHTNAVWVNPQIRPEEGIRLGNIYLYTILNFHSFRNHHGVVWTWHREVP